MAVTFTYDVGYMGVVKVAQKTILATSGSVQVEQTPIFSSGVWGAGWYNAAQQVAYAPHYKHLLLQIELIQMVLNL